MSFLSPMMLIGLLAAGLPLLIHLLRRRTAGRVLWGAWMFLYESIRKKRRKLMLEDVLLLVLRTLLVISAVLAFSRPFLKEIRLFGIAGCDKDVVIVIDTSASMRLSGSGGKASFDQAIEEACELVRLSPEGTAFGIVCGESTPAILTSAPISDKREITALMEKIKATSDAMDVPRTLAAAGEVLAGGNNPAKEIIIFGDGQGYGWRPGEKAEWARVERIFERFPVRPPVIWRSFLRPEKVRNAAIAAVVPSSRVIGTDRPVSFTVSIVNSGSEAYAPGDAVFSVDGAEKARLPVGQILPGLSRTFSFTHRFEKSGPRKVVTSLSNADDIMSDSTLTNTVDVIEKINVMLVDGRPDATGYDRAGAAKWKIITRSDCAFPEELGLPVILKVPKEGSTVGIIKVDKKEDWERALEEEFAMSDVLLAESFIKGVEISIPVIGGKAFDAIEIRSPKGFYDYDAKYVYKDGHTEYFCPPVSLNEEAVSRARQLAEEFYFITGCRDLVRVDFIVAEDNVPYILEGNTHPGCTATSLVPKSAKAGGVSFEALTARMVYSAMRRPVCRPQERGEKCSGLLVKLCIWMFRITLLLCALVLASSGIISLLTGLPGWPLVIAGALMIFSEIIFTWLKSMEKK